MSPELTDLRFTPAPSRLARAGLLGWATCRLGPVVIDGLAVRRTRRGHLTVEFPIRRDSHGRKHALVRPIHSAAREAIRQQVLVAAGLGDAP